MTTPTRKYELLGEEHSIEVGWPSGPYTLYRIRALVDIPRFDVKKGDLGGFVQSEENLSHEGDCWVDRDAKVYEQAVVRDSAWIFSHAHLLGTAVLSGTDVMNYGERATTDQTSDELPRDQWYCPPPPKPAGPKP
ncbi:MAG: hypothetical protein AB7I36_20405 [Rhodospirillaceae bacterium]